ncbi:MAG: CHAD domain-containing protein [Caldilineaceae bacterium]|nr:CHAD domain-containing protein [Caldilineaceae bacterium]
MSSRYQILKQEWRHALTELQHSAMLTKEGLKPIAAVASKRIRQIHKRALKEGRAIGPDSPASDLHDLRKTCKKLRYLLEFFQSLYDGGAIKRIVKELKLLQDNLGMFQDYEVQLHALRSFGKDMVAEGLISADALMAMGILIGHLYDRQHEARIEFSTCFANFDSKQNRDQFRKLLESAGQF